MQYELFMSTAIYILALRTSYNCNQMLITYDCYDIIHNPIIVWWIRNFCDTDWAQEDHIATNTRISTPDLWLQ